MVIAQLRVLQEGVLYVQNARTTHPLLYEV